MAKSIRELYHRKMSEHYGGKANPYASPPHTEERTAKYAKYTVKHDKHAIKARSIKDYK